MLLRSSSKPILNSWPPNSKDSSSLEPEIVHHIPRTRSIVSLSVSSSSSLIFPINLGGKKTTRVLSETEISDPVAVPKKKPMSEILYRFEEDEETRGLELGLRCAGTVVDEGCDVGARDLARVLVAGGIGGSGGKICGGGSGSGGGGSDGGGDGSSGFGDSNHGNRSTDLYYQKMIEANPGNPLLLSNYAKFLKDVQGDFVKAEEYCGRAILADPNDASVLSMYADLTWQANKDASRAEAYYDRAVKAAPDDCYVLASYARFLWDSEEEEIYVESKPDFFHGVPPTPPPLAAPS